MSDTNGRSKKRSAAGSSSPRAGASTKVVLFVCLAASVLAMIFSAVSSKHAGLIAYYYSSASISNLAGVVFDAVLSADERTVYVNTDDDDDDEQDGGEDMKKESPESDSEPEKKIDSRIGVVSYRGDAFFRKLQAAVDDDDNVQRCARYDAYYNATAPQPRRRIFYGALIAGEPWELLEMVAAEVYGVYSGMVFVEGNRTQSFSPRQFQRLEHSQDLQRLFGVDNSSSFQVRAYVNENPKLIDLEREHNQRQEILKGWKEIGMQPDDVGLLADTDEVLTRDFLRAIQYCDGFDFLNYHDDQHHCQHTHIKMVSNTRVFESSPECIVQGRSWFHPDMILGHCIDHVGDSAVHPPAPRDRDDVFRAAGFGSECSDWEGERAVPQNRYPTWSAADFRRTCGGRMYHMNKQYADQHKFDRHTGFHFHNFFEDLNKIRHKYLTYGHPDMNAPIKPVYNLSNDLKLMYKCVKNLTDEPDQVWKREVGGFGSVDPLMPIYFQDENYRQRRHAYVQEMVEHDEVYIAELQQHPEWVEQILKDAQAGVSLKKMSTRTASGDTKQDTLN
jgi:Glycosyltransferase family 17